MFHGCNTTYVGSGLQIRYYGPNGGAAFAGPFKPGQVAGPKLGSFLNMLTGGFGIHSQAAVDQTVFVLLYAPNLAVCPSNNASNNSQTGPGSATAYGSFVYATIHLEDMVSSQDSCPGDLNDISTSTGISPEQFATFATSHELDEAITSPGPNGNVQSGGWTVSQVGGQGQVADPCQTRSASGQVGPSYPFFNFTRDSRGTVVAAYVNPQTGLCWP